MSLITQISEAVVPPRWRQNLDWCVCSWQVVIFQELDDVSIGHPRTKSSEDYCDDGIVAGGKTFNGVIESNET